MPSRVAWFPSAAEMAANPYWPLLRSSLESLGVEFEDSATFGGRWLWAKRQQVSILHFHYIQQFYAYQTVHAQFRWVARLARNLLLARSLGYRTVFTLHNLSPTYPLRPMWTDYLGHWLAANLTNSVIVHCEKARELLSRQFGRRRGVYVTPHPHYRDVYPNTISREEARSRLGLEMDQMVYAFVGGIRTNKGVDKLISAFSSVPGQHLRLVVAGRPWPPVEYLRRLMDMAGRDERIHIYPHMIPDDDLQVFLNAADVVVSPFESILTSGSAILAMSFGRPVVVPSTGCLPELVIPDAGILYEPSAPAGLPDALKACTRADLHRMGQCAQRKVKRFTWARMARQTLAIYAGA